MNSVRAEPCCEPARCDCELEALRAPVNSLWTCSLPRGRCSALTEVLPPPPHVDVLKKIISFSISDYFEGRWCFNSSDICKALTDKHTESNSDVVTEQLWQKYVTEAAYFTHYPKHLFCISLSFGMFSYLVRIRQHVCENLWYVTISKQIYGSVSYSNCCLWCCPSLFRLLSTYILFLGS